LFFILDALIRCDTGYHMGTRAQCMRSPFFIVVISATLEQGMHPKRPVSADFNTFDRLIENW